MKTMSAHEAKNGFGLMIDTARAEPVLIEKHGRGVGMVIIAIDTRIAGGGGRVHWTACIDVPCCKIAASRRKLIAEVARYTAMYHP